MAEDFYDDDEEAVAAPEPTEKEESEGAETLVPKSFCEGMAVDDTGRFKVVKVLEEEMVIRYMKDESPEEVVEEEVPEEVPDLMD